MNYLRTHLGAKLFLSYFIVIFVGVLALTVTAPAIVPQVFNRHLGGMGMGMGMGPSQGASMMQELFIGFRDGVFESLALAAGASVLVAVIISLFFSRGILRPLLDIMQASQRIADGNYDERVNVSGADELGQLADRFNQMAEKLNQVEAMRRQLIGDVSHELRTPLTTIKGSLEGLMDGVLPAENETYQLIHQEADRLNGLVDDLQELSRVEAGAYELDLQPTYIAPLADTLDKRFRQQFDAKRVKLNFNLPLDLPPLLADEHRVIQVFTNLISNALQYTSAGGAVTVDAVRANDMVKITVRDTGAGIKPEYLPHLFDRFYRVDKSRSRAAGGGSGIGLTIARFLVEAHGGNIEAESEGAGKGSAFMFTLPLQKS